MTDAASYDSTQDTLAHIGRVQDLLRELQTLLEERAIIHDASKLEEPEKSCFDEYTPKLRDSTFGSDEYKDFLVGMGEGLKHHYAHNSHHPEHFRWHCPVCQLQINDAAHETAPQGPNDSGVRYCPRCCLKGMLYESELMLKPELGINGMTLLDLVEMFVDWKAGSERHANGSLERSIRINQERFKMSQQLADIFENTRRAMGW